MKINKYLLCQLFLICSLFSCNTESLQTDLKGMNLKGDVVGIQENATESFSFFNENGNFDKSYQDPKNKLSIFTGSFTEYTYKDDRIEKKINTNGSSSGKSQITSIYTFEKEKLITETTFTDDNLINSKKTFYYGKNNLLERDSTILETNFKDEKTIQTFGNRYTYNENEELVKKTNYSKWEKSLSTTIYNYKNGDVYDEIEDGKTKAKYEYIFDTHGNWIQQKNTLSGDIINRTIYYRGEDITEFIKKFNEVKSRILEPKIKKSKTSNNFQSTNQPRQKQYINCSYCHGTGLYECWSCQGTGYNSNGDRCLSCGGRKGNCGYCSGRGQVVAPD